ncbi:MAG: protein kinase [Candidatus Eisenbacteria bacterium]|nr:protein kinase [Candidatus Eisenbacteria bacterium]
MNDKSILHYTILRQLGAGGMGAVYLARDTRVDRLVALKFLGDDAVQDAQARSRFAREARAAARLSHTGIVTLYALEESDGQSFLVQEYVEGETLAQRLARGALEPAEAARCARELAGALAHAHAQGVLHRDLKPENILVSTQGTFKIADFGIAHLEGATTLTQTGAVLGTLSYMPPERVRGEAGDVRADLFSLGAILYETVSGRRAFGGRTNAEVLYAVLNVDPPAIESTDAALGPLIELTARLIAKQPGQRPDSAQAVVESLASGVSLQPGGHPAAVRWPATRRAAIARIAAATAAVVVLAVSALLVWQRAHPAARSKTLPGIAVLSFENDADPSDRDRTGAIAGNLLLTSLAQSSHLNVLSTQGMLDIMRSLGKGSGPVDRALALRAARRARAGRLVAGTILQTTPSIVITAEVCDVADGRVVKATRVEGKPGQTVFQVVDALSALLVQTAFAAGGEAALQPVAERASGDLAAYRAYVEGLAHQSRGDLPAAEERLGEALRRDPRFAQAYYQLAVVQWWHRRPSESYATLQKTLTLADRLSPMERALAHAMTFIVLHDCGKAREPFLRLAQLYPRDKSVLFGVQQACDAVGDLDRAVDAGRRVLELDPDFAIAAYTLSYDLIARGRSEEALKLATGMLERNPGNRYLGRIVFDISLYRGDVDGALRIAHAIAFPKASYPRDAAQLLVFNLTGRPDPALWSVATSGFPWQAQDDSLALVYWEALRRGRFREGVRIARHAWQVISITGIPEGPEIPVANGVNAAVGAGDFRLALEWSDSITTRVSRWGGVAYDFTVRMMKIESRFDLGRDAQAGALLRSIPPTEGRYGEEASFLAYNRGLALASRGRYEDALKTFEEAQSSAWMVLRRGMWRRYHADFLVGAGRTREALEDFDRLSKVPTVMPDEAVRLWLYKGRVLEKLQRTAEARAAYRQLLSLWKDADPGVPEVAEARAALQRLGGG